MLNINQPYSKLHSRKHTQNSIKQVNK